MANPIRVQIVSVLASSPAPMRTSEIAKAVGHRQAVVSKYLGFLSTAGLVTAKVVEKGRTVHQVYRPTGVAVTLLSDVGAHGQMTQENECGEERGWRGALDWDEQERLKDLVGWKILQNRLDKQQEEELRHLVGKQFHEEAKTYKTERVFSLALGMIAAYSVVREWKQRPGF